MNLVQKMLLKIAGVKESQTYSLTDATLGRFFGSTSHSGKMVTDDAMMQVSVAWCCQRILAETIASLPLDVYQDDGDGKIEKARDHPVADVLNFAPNQNMTGVEYMESKVLNLTQSGNAYSYREQRSNGDLISLTPIESKNVEPKQRENGAVYYKILERGKWEDVPQEKIWHVKGFGRNGLVGLSPLGAAREVLGTALAMEEFGSKFFSQGGMPSGTVTVPGWLNPDQRAIARENLNQMLGGLGNAHKFALMEGGMTPQPWGSMPLEDMQFILARKFSIQEMCRFYRIPPHMVADLERATFSNIEQMSLEFVMFTLMPYFTRFESSASKWLFKKDERRKYFLRFNYEGLLRADSAARAAFFSQMLQNGVMTRNEARAKEKLPRSEDEGMDEYTVQANMMSMKDLGKVMEKPAPVVQKHDTVNNIEVTGMGTVAEAIKSVSIEASHAHERLLLLTRNNNESLISMVGSALSKSQDNLRASIENPPAVNIDLAGMDDLATALEKAAERSSLSVAALVAQVIKSSEDSSKVLSELVAIANADREFVMENGEPIGTKVVRK